MCMRTKSSSFTQRVSVFQMPNHVCEICLCMAAHTHEDMQAICPGGYVMCQPQCSAMTKLRCRSEHSKCVHFCNHCYKFHIITCSHCRFIWSWHSRALGCSLCRCSLKLASLVQGEHVSLPEKYLNWTEPVSVQRFGSSKIKSRAAQLCKEPQYEWSYEHF